MRKVPAFAVATIAPCGRLILATPAPQERRRSRRATGCVAELLFLNKQLKVDLMDASPRGAKLFAIIALRLAAACGLALALSACIGPDLDSVGDYGAGLSPFATASVPDRPRPVQVFIASTRKGETGEAAREQAPEAHYALATMTVPPGHRAGSIEEPLWGKPNGRNDIALAGERELDDDEFRAELASHVSGPRRRQPRRSGVRARLQHQLRRCAAARRPDRRGRAFRRRDGAVHLAVEERPLRLRLRQGQRHRLARRAAGAVS